MSPLTIEVHSRIVGAQPEALALEPVLLELFDERITVAELIRRTVAEQVRNLLVRRKLDAEEAQQALARQYLTANNITAQAEQGAIRYPSKRTQSVPQINTELQVQKAFQAFLEKRYLILINGQAVEGLDDELTFDLDAKITFLRLTPLVGG